MNSLAGLIARLERTELPDRRLDADVVARLLGPPGCVINPFITPDGWDIETAPNAGGETTYWREAADVGHLTELIEDAIAFIAELRPTDGAKIIADAVRRAPASQGLGPVAYAASLARTMIVATLRTVAAEEEHDATYAA